MNYDRERVDRAKAVALAERFYVCWGNEDVVGMSNCLEQNADSRHHMHSHEGHFHGRSNIIGHRTTLLPPGAPDLVIDKIVCSDSGKEVAVFWHCASPAGDHRLRGAEWLAMNPSVTAIRSIASELNPITAAKRDGE